MRKLSGCYKTLGHLRETLYISGLLSGETSGSSWHFCWSWVLSRQPAGHLHGPGPVPPTPDGGHMWHWDIAMLLVGVQ